MSLPSLQSLSLYFSVIRTCLVQSRQCFCCLVWLCTTRLISLSGVEETLVLPYWEHLALFELHFPNSAICCTIFPQVFCPIASFPHPVVSVSNVHVCILARRPVCGLEIQKGRQACGCRLSLSRCLHQFGVWSCNPGGVGPWKTRAKSNIDVSRVPQVHSISTTPAAHAHLGSMFSPITNSAACTSDPRKWCVYFLASMLCRPDDARDLQSRPFQTLATETTCLGTTGPSVSADLEKVTEAWMCAHTHLPVFFSLQETKSLDVPKLIFAWLRLSR